MKLASGSCPLSYCTDSSSCHSCSLRCRGNPGEGALVPRRTPYTCGALPMMLHVLKRQATLFKRDPTLSRARIVQVTVIGLLIGGLWFDLAVTPENARCAAALALQRFGMLWHLARLALLLTRHKLRVRC